MRKALKAAVEYYKREGLINFIGRVISWIPEYIRWLKVFVSGKLTYFLCEYSDTYRRYLRVQKLEQDSKIDSCVRFKNIVGEIKYFEMVGQAYEILNENEKIEVVLPECFGEGGKEIRVFDSPPIYLTIFSEVEIYGATSILSKGKIAISDMYDRNLEENRYNIEGGCLIVCQRDNKWIDVAYKQTDCVIEQAIYCMGGGCGNYYHFTFEILSRLSFVDRYEEYRSIPILIDSVSLKIPQMKELVDRINIYHHQIIPIDEYNRVHVKQLVYVSKNLWLPPNYRFGAAPMLKDFLISRSVVDNIRDRVLLGQTEDEVTVYKKIYLSRRKCAVQRLANSVDVESIFIQYGYHIVFMEELTFDRQVTIINHADIIVGVGGAAFTNLVYCHKNAKVGLITNCRVPFAFSNIANMVGVEFVMVMAENVTLDKYASNDTFKLDKDKCVEFIQYIEELS